MFTTYKINRLNTTLAKAREATASEKSFFQSFWRANPDSSSARSMGLKTLHQSTSTIVSAIDRFGSIKTMIDRMPDGEKKNELKAFFSNKAEEFVKIIDESRFQVIGPNILNRVTVSIESYPQALFGDRAPYFPNIVAETHARRSNKTMKIALGGLIVFTCGIVDAMFAAKGAPLKLGPVAVTAGYLSSGLLVYNATQYFGHFGIENRVKNLTSPLEV